MKQAKKNSMSFDSPFNSEYENAGFKLVAISVASAFLQQCLQR